MKFTKKRFERDAGISLIEILIVVTIFAVLGIVVARSIILTLQGSKKSEGLVAVTENLSYTMRVIEGQIRNANSITRADLGCNLGGTTGVTYLDQDGNKTDFTYNGQSISSGSAVLTSSDVKVTNATFACNNGTSTTQASVEVYITVQSATLTGIQNSTESQTTRIYLRNY